MELNSQAIIEPLLEGLKKDLQAIPAFKDFRWDMCGSGADQGFDAIAQLSLKDASRPLQWAIEIKARSLEPRMADLIGARLKELIAKNQFDSVLVLAPYVSELSAQKLESRNIGHWDASGNCRIASGTVYMERKGFPNKFIRESTHSNFFTRAGQRLLRVLLDPELVNRAWTLRELQEATYPGVSLGQVQSLVKALESSSYISRTEEGLKVQDPEKLLRAWATRVDRKRIVQRKFYTSLSQEAFRKRFEELLPEMAVNENIALLASFSAAAILDPYVRQHRNYLYWTGDQTALADALKMKPVLDGENVVAYIAPDRGVFYGWRPGQPPVTCLVQTFIDLMREGGRGKEAAEHLFEQHLNPRYTQ